MSAVPCISLFLKIAVSLYSRHALDHALTYSISSTMPIRRVKQSIYLLIHPSAMAERIRHASPEYIASQHAGINEFIFGLNVHCDIAEAITHRVVL